MFAAGLLAAGAALRLAPASSALGQRWAGLERQLLILGAGGCVLVATWFGVLTGLFEVLHRALRYHGFDVALRLPPHMVWMTPLAYTVMFLVVAAAAWLLRPLWRGFRSMQVLVLVLTALAVWSQLLIYPVIDEGVAVLPAVGLGLAAARAVPRWRDGGLLLMRRSVPWMVGVVLLGGVAVSLNKQWSENEHLAGLPEPAANAPNVLLIVLDTVRADHLGFHGYERDTTPSLDRLAADSVVFERFCSSAPWTLPAHATMFTGLWGFEHGADWLTPMDGTCKTLAEVFSENGYATGGFVGNVSYCSSDWGIDRGFAHYDDYEVNPIIAAYSASLFRALTPELGFFYGIRNDAETVTDNFLEWLSTTEKRPFFAFLNYFDAHALYLPPPPYDTRFGPSAGFLHDWFSIRRDPTDEEMESFVRAYDGCIAYLDSHIGRMLDELRERGALDNTLIIVTGDHGEHFGEHSLYEHANGLYMPLLHVPLVISFPGELAAKRVDGFASLRDLPATILDLAVPAAAGALPGHSLVPLFEPTNAPDVTISPVLSQITKRGPPGSHMPATRGDMISLIAAGRHLIVNGDGVLELYDLRTDPGEERDLVESGKAPDAAERLHRKIRAIVSGAPR